MSSDYSVLKTRFTEECVQKAISIAITEAGKYAETYYTGHANFVPHVWVVAGICDGLSKGYQAGMEDSVGN